MLTCNVNICLRVTSLHLYNLKPIPGSVHSVCIKAKERFYVFQCVIAVSYVLPYSNMASLITINVAEINDDSANTVMLFWY